VNQKRVRKFHGRRGLHADPPDQPAIDTLACDDDPRVELRPAALITHDDGLARPPGDARDDVTKIAHRLAVDRGNLIARLQSRARCRPVGQYMPQYRRYGRLPKFKPQTFE
jgi:hypothetical protein